MKCSFCSKSTHSANRIIGDYICYDCAKSLKKQKPMIGNAVMMTPRAHEPTWYVMWDVLGYTDYKEIIAPWCEDNLEHRFQYQASSTVEVCTEADALLLFMRFK